MKKTTTFIIAVLTALGLFFAQAQNDPVKEDVKQVKQDVKKTTKDQKEATKENYKETKKEVKEEVKDDKAKIKKIVNKGANKN